MQIETQPLQINARSRAPQVPWAVSFMVSGTPQSQQNSQKVAWEGIGSK